MLVQFVLHPEHFHFLLRRVNHDLGDPFSSQQPPLEQSSDVELQWRRGRMEELQRGRQGRRECGWEGRALRGGRKNGEGFEVRGKGRGGGVHMGRRYEGMEEGRRCHRRRQRSDGRGRVERRTDPPLKRRKWREMR